MTLLNDELTRLVEERQIALEEAVNGAVDKRDLQWRFRSGVSIAADPPGRERFRVVSVAPGSPGEQAGLQRGLLIVEINGRPVPEYSLEEARQVFRTDGRHILTVERAGKRSKLTFELTQLGLLSK